MSTMLTGAERGQMEQAGIAVVLGKPPYQEARDVTVQRYTHRYRGPGAAGESVCDVTVVVDGDKAAVVLSERQDNRGRSVTNAVEQLAAEIYAAKLARLKPGRVAWVEHYERGMPANGRTFDRVKLGYVYQPEGDVRFYGPSWERVPPKA